MSINVTNVQRFDGTGHPFVERLIAEDLYFFYRGGGYVQAQLIARGRSKKADSVFADG
ncbi:hypothetical protein [Parapedobacter defluvii]|uniref:hypothetical protein n=1 Tax=Parapedobacter defluvii TaxID=2045106 RepID=UPI003341E4AA